MQSLRFRQESPAGLRYGERRTSRSPPFIVRPRLALAQFDRFTERDRNPTEGSRMDHTRSLSTRSRWVALGLLIPVLVAGLAGPAAAQAKPEGEMRWALYVTLAPVWLDPAEVQGQITPFWVMYAIHDALVKPMLMLINPYPWSAPLEEVRLKAR